MVRARGLATAAGLALVMWATSVCAQAPTTAPTQEVKPADANDDITSDIELTRAAIQVRRQALVTAAMDLQAKEAEKFWPLYRDYRLAMAKDNDRFVKLLTTYLESYESLTDEAATKMLDAYLGIERDRTNVKRQYVRRFHDVLPARKVARFFQIDHKLDAVINAELAYNVPLAR